MQSKTSEGKANAKTIAGKVCQWKFATERAPMATHQRRPVRACVRHELLRGRLDAVRPQPLPRHPGLHHVIALVQARLAAAGRERRL